MKKLMTRNSSIVSIPQQFVTVEFHNSMEKKKQRHYRNSIINEIKLTEDLIQQTLNKEVNVNLHTSKFAPNLKAENSFFMTKKDLMMHEKIKTERQLQSPILNADINHKLAQINTISSQFLKACEQQKKCKIKAFHEGGTYSLPIKSPFQTPAIDQKKMKEEIIQHKTMVKEWRNKVNQSREFVRRIKTKRRQTKFKYGQFKQNTEYVQQKVGQNSKPSTLKTLRELYYKQTRKQRKTAPIQSTSNHLQQLLCEYKQKKPKIPYLNVLERYSAKKLQQFIEGGQCKPQYEFSKHINLSEFINCKQKYSTMQKIYNHIKQNNIYKFKDMSADSFSENNLLSVVYYIENCNNLTEIQKKCLKKKLYLVD